MKSLLQDKYSNLVNKDENYIIFDGGKPIVFNVLDEDSFDIDVDEFMDSEDICYRKRPDYEEKIISNAKFTVFLDIRKDIDLKLLYLNNKENNIAFAYEVERDLKVKFTNIVINEDNDSNILFDYNLNDNCKVEVLNFSASKSNMNMYFNYYLDDKANIEINNLNINEGIVKSLSQAYLYEARSNAIINNSVINTTGLNQEYKYNLYHLEKKTSSELICYGICNNKSQLNLDTNGFIKNGASGSSIYQKSKGIILDLESSVTASPWLQIDEYDCKATHGASIGAIDENDIFYLMSRGLKRDESINLIVNGFFNPFLSKISDAKLFDFISNIISNHIN